MKVARYVILIIVAIVFAVLAVPRLGASIEGIQRYYTQELEAQAETVADNELSKTSGELFVGQSDKLFTIAGVVFAALFALIAAKKDEGKLRLKDVPEILEILMASIALFVSAAYHLLLVRRYSLWLQVQAGLPLKHRPKISNEDLSGYFLQQSTMLLVGICIGVVALLSANLLRNPDETH